MIRRLVPLALVLALLGAFGIQPAPSPRRPDPPPGVTGIALDGRLSSPGSPSRAPSGYTVYRGTTASTNITHDGHPGRRRHGDELHRQHRPRNSTTYYYVVRGGRRQRRVARTRPSSQVTPRSLAPARRANAIVTRELLPGRPPAGTSTDADDVPTRRHRGLRDRERASTAASRSTSRSTRAAGARTGSRSTAPATTAAPGRGSSRPSRPHGRAPSPPATDPERPGLSTARTGRTSATLTTTSSWPSGIYLHPPRARRHRLGQPRSCSSSATTRPPATSSTSCRVHRPTRPTTTTAASRSTTSTRSGANTVAGADRAVKVSFDRPYEQPRTGAARLVHDAPTCAMVCWLERQGYDVGYVTNTDLDARPGAGAAATTAVHLAGHDEYYSAAMRNALSARARRRHVPLLQRRERGLLEDPLRGEPDLGRLATGGQVCYKTRRVRPARPERHPTGTWRDPAGANKPENALVRRSCTSATTTSPSSRCASAPPRAGPRLAPHRPGRPRARHLPERSAPALVRLGVGRRASTTAASRRASPCSPPRRSPASSSRTTAPA